MSDTPEYDPEIDIDPNEAIELDYDEETDTDEDPKNDADHPYEPEEVEGAEPVDEAVADAEIPSAEDEIEED